VSELSHPTPTSQPDHGGAAPPRPPGVIFDIQRFSVHDGPGIRTLVFFKGCPLACLWCSNPESQHFGAELLFDPAKCVACGGCVGACPHRAVRREGDRVEYEREACVACGRCVDVCYAEARTMAGRQVTVAEVLAEVCKDAPFFARSGGGVTLGGGEPLAQAEFALAILRECRAQDIHTAIETCGHVPWSASEAILPWTDLFLFDLKHLDTLKHRSHTGGDVSRIVSNLRQLAASGARVTVRVPVVPGFNDTLKDIRAIADHVASIGIRELHLLPYHRLGQNKYRLLGRNYNFMGSEKVAEARLKALRAEAQAAGLHVQFGG
jgi:pyruvate formate lyase activating enzyme